MGKLIVYGASDDLVEVDGDIREEFPAYELDDGGYVAVSDGTLLRVIYDKDGCWRLNRLVAGAAKYSKTDGDPKGDYTDRVMLDSDTPFTFIVFGKHHARASQEKS